MLKMFIFMSCHAPVHAYLILVYSNIWNIPLGKLDCIE